MSNPVSFQTVIEYVEALSTEYQPPVPGIGFLKCRLFRRKPPC